MRMSSEWRELRKAAEQQGWLITVTGKCHLKWKPPQGGPIFSAGTPSDRRSYANTKAMLTRAGLKL